MATGFQNEIGRLNDVLIRTFGIPMTIDGQPVNARFVRPLKDIRSNDGKRPAPYIDVKNEDIASIDTSSGNAVIVEDEEYVIVSREPGYYDRTTINLRRAI